MRNRSELRAAREAAGLSQMDVAAYLNRSQAWVSRVESGEIVRLSLKDGLGICKAYGIPISALVDEELLEDFPQALPPLDGLRDDPVSRVEPERVAAGGER